MTDRERSNKSISKKLALMFRPSARSHELEDGYQALGEKVVPKKEAQTRKKVPATLSAPVLRAPTADPLVLIPPSFAPSVTSTTRPASSLESAEEVAKGEPNQERKEEPTEMSTIMEAANVVCPRRVLITSCVLVVGAFFLLDFYLQWYAPGPPDDHAIQWNVSDAEISKCFSSSPTLIQYSTEGCSRLRRNVNSLDISLEKRRVGHGQAAHQQRDAEVTLLQKLVNHATLLHICATQAGSHEHCTPRYARAQAAAFEKAFRQLQSQLCNRSLVVRCVVSVDSRVTVYDAATPQPTVLPRAMQLAESAPPCALDDSSRTTMDRLKSFNESLAANLGKKN